MNRDKHHHIHEGHHGSQARNTWPTATPRSAGIIPHAGRIFGRSSPKTGTAWHRPRGSPPVWPGAAFVQEDPSDFRPILAPTGDHGPTLRQNRREAGPRRPPTPAYALFRTRKLMNNIEGYGNDPATARARLLERECALPGAPTKKASRSLRTRDALRFSDTPRRIPPVGHGWTTFCAPMSVSTIRFTQDEPVYAV